MSIIPTHALTIRNPWAWAIAEGFKTIENRTWRTHYRGPIYIHVSAKRCAPHALENCRVIASKVSVVLPDPSLLVRGCLIATADLIDCTRGHWDTIDPWAEPGAWHFRLANIRKLPAPIPASGKLGFWRV